MSAKEYAIVGVIIVLGFFGSNLAFNIFFPTPAPVLPLPETLEQQMLIDLINQNERQQEMNREMRDFICKVNFNDDKALYGEEYAHGQLELCIKIVD